MPSPITPCPTRQLDAVVAPVSTIVAKGSLLPEGSSFDIVNMNVLRKQTVIQSARAISSPTIQAKPRLPRQAGEDRDQDHPGLGQSPGRSAKSRSRRKLALTPDQVPSSSRRFKLKRGEKQKVVAERRVRLAEENCLARAVYFEARSESELGQLAVAKVILNRTRDPDYPKTICGVVYQGSGSRNSCQFSFACDGLPDDVKQPGAWANSKRIAQKAIAGDHSVGAIGTATNYHADYVKPKWARSMKRLIKIGRHIFYSDT